MDFYGSVAEATAYHESLGNTAWTAAGVTDAQREVALRRGSRALDGIFGPRLTGAKMTPNQRLAWGRVGVFDRCANEMLPDGLIPPAVVEAAYELSLVALSSPSSLTPSVDLSRLTKSEAVDGVGSRSFFGPNELGVDAWAMFRPRVTVTEDLMACYLKSELDSRWIARVI